MEYQIRNLKAPDLFLVSTIISKLGVREVKDCFNGEDLKALIGNEKNINFQAIGMTIALDIVGILLENLSKCEKEIYQLLSNLTGLKLKDIQELDATVFVDLISQVIMNPNNKDFFKLASRFLNTTK